MAAMTRSEFAREFGGILRLLREHSFLAYSKGGRQEYEEKVRAAVDSYAHLVRRMTGVPVSALYELIPIDSVRQPTFEGGKGLALRAAVAIRRRAGSAAGAERTRLSDCAARWKQAAERLGEPEAG